MEIRSAEESDIPSIIDLLKASLGQSLLQKSVEFWNWKHISNPFGKSPVLVAEDRARIIGVRAFMQWNFSLQDKTFKALRAVDTATHPNYQGRGIFRKLTLQLVDQCIDDGYDFIFNTPNEKSKPGYLKMGWKEYGRIGVNLRPGNFLKASNPGLVEHQGYNEIPNYEGLHTTYSQQYYDWRYSENSTISYACYHSRDDSMAIYCRYKKSNNYSELRICDICGDAKNPGSLRKVIIRLERSTIISWLNQTGSSAVRFGFFPKLKIGPTLTFRPLRMQEAELRPLLAKMNFSLGDMELF